ncbi:hypothetical protein MNBD_GAMMA12-3219 [hydrothermal vent metagenome]|uniref:Uncharacterized protein n=1 Tax=hydrothermal vent metagenome TaxID=652676 RepID=A0A3B0ZBH2_9ZZZZ
MKISKLLKLTGLLGLFLSSVCSANDERAEVVGDFNQEGEFLFAAPIFKSFNKIDLNGNVVKGNGLSKIFGAGRNKLMLLPGNYSISGICSGSQESTVGKITLALELGLSYKLVCSRKAGEQALIIKAIKETLINKWAPKS